MPYIKSNFATLHKEVYRYTPHVPYSRGHFYKEDNATLLCGQKLNEGGAFELSDKPIRAMPENWQGCQKCLERLKKYLDKFW